MFVLCCLLWAAVMPRRGRAPANPEDDGQARLAAAMRGLQNELRTLRWAANAARDAPIADGPVSGISLMQWIGLKIDNFDGSGTPIQAADWLPYVEDKMEAFAVLAQDRVRYGSQLLKAEAQIWWKGVQLAHTVAHAPLT